MSPEETEIGRMNIWEKCLHAGLAAGHPVQEAIAWAEQAVTAFEARFHQEPSHVDE